MKLPPKSVLMYDADCGPCRAFTELVSFLDFRRTVVFVPLRQADEEGLMDDLPQISRYSAAHLLLPDGKIVSGAGAMVELLGILPGGSLVSGFFAGCGPGMQLSEFLYSVISRMHSTRSCRAVVQAPR